MLNGAAKVLLLSVKQKFLYVATTQCVLFGFGVVVVVVLVF
jgi:hypothetical protein